MRQVARSDDGSSEPDPTKLSVAPVRLRDPGGGRRSAALAILVLVAAVTIAVAIPMLLADQPRPTPPAIGRATVTPTYAASSEPTAEPTPAPTLRLPDEVYNAHELGQVVDAGELDGRLVLVRGRLEAVPLPCEGEPDAERPCVMLAIEGVDLPVTAGVVTLPWHDDPPADDYLVVVPDGDRLVYIGHVAPDRPWPATIDGLTRALLRSDPDGAPAELFLVDGWLVPDPPPDCAASPAPLAGRCYEPGPFLADEPPIDGGQPVNRRGSTVVIGDAVGFDPAADVIDGPFLVGLLTAEQCSTTLFQHVCGGTGARWVVEAAYNGSAVWAHVP